MLFYINLNLETQEIKRTGWSRGFPVWIQQGVQCQCPDGVEEKLEDLFSAPQNDWCVSEVDISHMKLKLLVNVNVLGVSTCQLAPS